MTIASLDEFYSLLKPEPNVVSVERDDAMDMSKVSVNGTAIFESEDWEFTPANVGAWTGELVHRHGGFSRPMKLARVLTKAIAARGLPVALVETDYRWGDVELKRRTPLDALSREILEQLSPVHPDTGLKLHLKDGGIVFGQLDAVDDAAVHVRTAVDHAEAIPLAAVAAVDVLDGPGTVLRTRWHAHLFSPAADEDADDQGGRFDAVQDADTGALFVWDVGLQRVVKLYKTKPGAIAGAKAAARRWDAAAQPTHALLRALPRFTRITVRHQGDETFTGRIAGFTDTSVILVHAGTGITAGFRFADVAHVTVHTEARR